jgi:hypothetical protein
LAGFSVRYSLAVHFRHTIIAKSMSRGEKPKWVLRVVRERIGAVAVSCSGIRPKQLQPGDVPETHSDG